MSGPPVDSEGLEVVGHLVKPLMAVDIRHRWMGGFAYSTSLRHMHCGYTFRRASDVLESSMMHRAEIQTVANQ
jgi:hypothetical protein